MNNETIEIFKFGGASVKDIPSIANAADIIQHDRQKRILVFSAMGKTTNALEKIASAIWEKRYTEAQQQWEERERYFTEIINGLNINVPLPLSPVEQYRNLTCDSFDELYDQVVSEGELLSSKIMSAYLSSRQIKNLWVDITLLLLTDNNYRHATVNLETSEQRIRRFVEINEAEIYVTQGFIGGGREGRRTTMGRESSDYTATLLASFLNAAKVIIWKDVPGVYDSDPKTTENSILYNELSYQQARELAHNGAQIIHPKTIDPIEKKHIPLYVKPFLNPEEPGTIIH